MSEQSHARGLWHGSARGLFGDSPGPSSSPFELSETGLVGRNRARRGLQNVGRGPPNGARTEPYQRPLVWFCPGRAVLEASWAVLERRISENATMPKHCKTYRKSVMFAPRASLGKPLRSLLGRLGGLLGASLGLLGPLGGLLGPLGAEISHFRFVVPVYGLVGAVLGPSWAVLGSSWAVLGPSWAVCGPSWGDLGPTRGHLESILGHLGAIVGNPARHDRLRKARKMKINVSPRREHHF